MTRIIVVDVTTGDVEAEVLMALQHRGGMNIGQVVHLTGRAYSLVHGAINRLEQQGAVNSEKNFRNRRTGRVSLRIKVVPLSEYLGTPDGLAEVRKRHWKAETEFVAQMERRCK